MSIRYSIHNMEAIRLIVDIFSCLNCGFQNENSEYYFGVCENCSKQALIVCGHGNCQVCHDLAPCPGVPIEH